MAKPLNPDDFPLRVPPESATPEQLIAFKDRWFNDMSVVRCREMERMALNIYYTSLDKQWIEPDNDFLSDDLRTWSFKDISMGPGKVQMPQPVTNYIAPAVEIELAHLTKRELTAAVVASGTDPQLEFAARRAKEILEHRLQVNSWPDLREAATHTLVITGTVGLKSYWDESYEDTTTIANPEAQMCSSPTCQTVVSSPIVAKSQMEGIRHAETAVDQVPNYEGEDNAKLTNCPTCEVPTPMVPYTPSPQEAESRLDHFKRPMGLQTPKGNTALEVVSPFDLYPENSGVDVDPAKCKIWGQATPRSLDWLEERYPDRCDELRPDNPAEIMKFHPILGEWQILGRYDSSLDSGIYDNHCRVYEIHALPSYRYPEGRSIVIAGEVVLENGPLLRTVETAEGVLKVPRVLYSAARFKPVHRQFWGRGLVDVLISPQNRLNGIDAQTIETRLRMGSPNLLASDDMDLTGPEWIAEGGNKVTRYSRSALDPTATPTIMEGAQMPPFTFNERQQTVQDMKELAGPQDIEQGEAPRNISTTSGLQVLGEQAERRRGPRERSLIAAFEKIWKHQLDLIWALRSEDDEYAVTSPDGAEELIAFNRTAIAGQTKVKIEKQAYVDRSLYQKEGTREAQADGLYILASQASRKRLLELRGLPTDVNPDLNRQVDCAREQWVNFINNGIIPTIDKTLDNHQIRFEVLGEMLLSQEGKRIEREAGWPQVAKAIAGWEEELLQMEVMDQMAVQFYGSRFIDPQAAAEMYAMGMVQFAEAQEQHQQMVQAGEQAIKTAPPSPDGGMAPPPMATPPPQQPPPPIFLPAAKEDRIFMVWQKLLGLQPGVMADEGFLRFRAVYDAYRLYAQEQAMQQAMMGPGGAPTAPGSMGAPEMGGTVPPNPMNGAQPAKVSSV
jgi:hypothetical protein